MVMIAVPVSLAYSSCIFSQSGMSRIDFKSSSRLVNFYPSPACASLQRIQHTLYPLIWLSILQIFFYPLNFTVQLYDVFILLLFNMQHFCPLNKAIPFCLISSALLPERPEAERLIPNGSPMQQRSLTMNSVGCKKVFPCFFKFFKILVDKSVGICYYN